MIEALTKEKWIGGGAKALAFLVLSGLVACDSSNSASSEPEPPDILPESRLEFVPRRAAAPALVTMDTSFWAVKGEEADVEIRYQGQGGPGTGKIFLEFELDEESLLRRPDGSLFAPGDSIQIRITVDPELILAGFEPTGLGFNPDEPALLEINYDEAEASFLVREGEFDIWRQERTGEPWERIGSAIIEDLDEIEALLTGFTRYALAIGR